MNVPAWLQRIFRTGTRRVVYLASDTGAREAAPVNTLCRSDQVLVAETGHFASRDGRWPSAWGCASRC